uniref:Uncharacterized protein n=1 Tax=virus sp. ct1Hk25 TaxID=2825803 RepID=A0A8S5RNA0_9VIRU|nr:MAG TPA: hypothetical protein [virus sp. ct1Hk25]DAV77857.1 MAG TPA: hypothetical protein [Bacteriophage sp.]
MNLNVSTPISGRLPRPQGKERLNGKYGNK